MKLLVVIALLFVLTETNFARRFNTRRGDVRQGIKSPSRRTNAFPSTSWRSSYSKSLNQQNRQIQQKTLGVKSLSSNYFLTRGRKVQKTKHTQRKSKINYLDHREKSPRCKRTTGKIIIFNFCNAPCIDFLKTCIF